MLLVESGLSALSYSVLARLLNELRPFMTMQFRRIIRASAFAAPLSIMLAALLAGCASKNPLMEEPVASTRAAPPASAPAAPRQAEAKPAEATADARGVTTTAPTGLRKFLGIFSPYRIDVQQGNFVSREMVAQLREGMAQKDGVTRDQVRFVLGTPLLTDIFHADRWDYLFRLQKGNGEVISSRVAVFFQNNRLVRIDGDQLPTEEEYLALIAGAAPGAKAAETGK
jgi:outer membrane protein assembly factor BamE